MTEPNGTTSSISKEPEKKALNGTLAGLMCYVFWGCAPLYWKLLGNVNSFEVIGHRVLWSFVFMTAVCLLLKNDFLKLLRDKRALTYLVPAGILIMLNWSVYIYAVDTNRVVYTALGYYINPLVSILFGVALFREKLSALQKAAVGLCACGVLYFLYDFGELPWISLVLAFSFGLYGAIKKKGGYPANEAMAIESTVVLPIAVGILVALPFITGTPAAFLSESPSGSGIDWFTTLMLVGSGPITAIPLILFAKAANSIPLSSLGFIQYVSPTIALLLGVFAFGEPFTHAHAVCFGCIWAGLALVSYDTIRKTRRREPKQPS